MSILITLSYIAIFILIVILVIEILIYKSMSPMRDKLREELGSVFPKKVQVDKEPPVIESKKWNVFNSMNTDNSKRKTGEAKLIRTKTRGQKRFEKLKKTLPEIATMGWDDIVKFLDKKNEGSKGRVQ